MKSIEVVAAIIYHKDKILCVQRGENKYPYISNKFEFPGGKLENGETKTEAIKREILEELNMDIDIQEEFLTVKHEYPDFKITMHSFKCICKSQELKLTEHISMEWLSINELRKLDWAAADIPIVNKLIMNG
jgi:8-oxo-dGTP diphosphatase